MATTEAERKRSKVAGALAGFRMGKAPDRSAADQARRAVQQNEEDQNAY